MDRGVRSGRWRGEGLGVNSTADIGCFQETHCGLLDLAFSPTDKHSQQISSQTFPSQFLPLGPIRLKSWKWYCCCLRLSVCPSVCLFVCDCWSISMTKLVLVITRIFFESFWNFPGIFFWWIILRQVRWWVLQLVKYAHTVEPIWKGQGSLTKVAKLGPFPGTILYKSCLFYHSWQATSCERPPSWVAFIEGFHCNWQKSAHWHFLNPWSHFLPKASFGLLVFS